MAKFLRKLGTVRNAKAKEPPLPPLEEYAKRPLLSELPEECQTMVRRAGLLPEEAESDFLVLLSCLFFELKHNPELSAALKALITKQKRVVKLENDGDDHVDDRVDDTGNNNDTCDGRQQEQLAGNSAGRVPPPVLTTVEPEETTPAPTTEPLETTPCHENHSNPEKEQQETFVDTKSPDTTAKKSKKKTKKKKRKYGKESQTASCNHAVEEGNMRINLGKESISKSNIGPVVEKENEAEMEGKMKSQDGNHNKITTTIEEVRNQARGDTNKGKSKTPETIPPVIVEGAGPSPSFGRTRGFSFSFFRSTAHSHGHQIADESPAPPKRFSASNFRPFSTPADLKKKENDAQRVEENGESESSQTFSRSIHNASQQQGEGSVDNTKSDKVPDIVRQDLFIVDNPSLQFGSRQKIGRGGFGDVYTGKDKASNQIVAIKILKKPYSECSAQICNELEILSSCQHDNIVNYLRSYYHKDRVWMIMEYCDGGTLHSLISGVDLNEGQIANVLGKVLNGLKYLHQQNRVHRDIKAENILLNINGDVKVADLGLCAELKDSDDSKAGMAGSRYWMAPEIIKRERYNCKVDIWSLGALAMEMAQQHPPWHGLPPLRVLFNIATKGAPPLKQPKKWSPEFKDFLTQCFAMDPDQRPSAEQLLSHPFIAKASPTSKLEQAISIVFLGDSLKMNGF